MARESKTIHELDEQISKMHFDDEIAVIDSQSTTGTPPVKNFPTKRGTIHDIVQINNSNGSSLFEGFYDATSAGSAALTTLRDPNKPESQKIAFFTGPGVSPFAQLTGATDNFNDVGIININQVGRSASPSEEGVFRNFSFNFDRVEAGGRIRLVGVGNSFSAQFRVLSVRTSGQNQNQINAGIKSFAVRFITGTTATGTQIPVNNSGVLDYSGFVASADTTYRVEIVPKSQIVDASDVYGDLTGANIPFDNV